MSLRPYGGSLFSGLRHRGVRCYWLQGTEAKALFGSSEFLKAESASKQVSFYSNF
jgi:hypothetical protein